MAKHIGSLPALRAGSVGQELRALRIMRGRSQKDLAKELGISAPQVSQIENGYYRPGIETIIKFLDVLDAHLEIELNEGGLFRDPSGSQEPPARPAP